MNMVIDYKRIAQHLKKARKNSMLKQHQVAEALGIVENTYSNIERAQQKPSLPGLFNYVCSIMSLLERYLMIAVMNWSG